MPLPDGMDARSAGPLFCGGVTVFAPYIDYDVKPTDRVGVIGIGGLERFRFQWKHSRLSDVSAYGTN